jgi:hypothetical protein
LNANNKWSQAGGLALHFSRWCPARLGVPSDGEIKDLAEPALVLSPETPTEGDDGLPTAPEVASLKLDADWVNTAAGDQGNAQALSDLARAFIYAGARALLVSHWPGKRAKPDTAGAAVLGCLR